jgi:HK97 gp10 family phage protein
MPNIEGLDKLLKQFESLKGLDTAKIAEVGGYVLMSESQKIAPYKTGYLSEHVDVKQAGKGAVMTYRAEYAFYQEYGTSKMKGKFFVRNTVDTKGNKIVDKMKEEVNKQIKEKI